MKAVFIGDDAEIASLTATSLRLRWPDCTPVVVGEHEAGLEMVEAYTPDIVILHVDGTDLALASTIQGLRRFSAVPLLVMSAQPDQLQLISALELGADDYVRLPCGLPELMARVLAVLRRAGVQKFDHGEGPVVKGELLINPATYEAFLGDRRLKLTVTEFRLLHILVSNSGRVVTHQNLEQTLWGDRWNGNGLVKKYVQRLRTKLETGSPGTSYIASVHGVGYRYVVSNSHALEQSAGEERPVQQEHAAGVSEIDALLVPSELPGQDGIRAGERSH